MKVAGIQRTSTIDFPGVLACVLFTRGCDTDCFYCHNRDLLGPGDCLPEGEVEAFLKKRRGLLDGVVVSGGEPLLQPDLEGFLAALKAMGYRVKLDTNGRQTQRVLALAEAGLCDYLAIDWKAPRRQYLQVCGVPPEQGYDATRETLCQLAEKGVPCEARTTLYPGLTAGALVELAGQLPPLPRYRLNFFRTPACARQRHLPLLERPFLTPEQVRAVEPQLRAVQPGLTF